MRMQCIEHTLTPGARKNEERGTEDKKEMKKVYIKQ